MEILKSKLSLDESIMLVTKTWAESRSKDPSTKVGACVYDVRTGGMFMGYNGFPAGVPDSADQWNRRSGGPGAVTKYDLVVHAEKNAIRKALMAGVDLSSCTLYCTHVPCPACMRDEIASNGIKRVLYETYQYASNDDHAEIVRTAIAAALGISIVKIERTQKP